MPAPVPATPPISGSRRRWGVYAGVAGVVAAIAIVVGIFAKSSSSTASSNVVAPAAAPAAPPTIPPAAPVAPSRPATPAPEPRHVLFASEPLDSRVFQDGQDLGAPPITIDVPVGQKVTVEVRREGYKNQLVSLDGSEKKVKINLVRVAGAGGRRPAPARSPAGESATSKAPASQPPSSMGGGEIVNPWAK